MCPACLDEGARLCQAYKGAMRNGHVNVLRYMDQHRCRRVPDPVIWAAQKSNVYVVANLHLKGHAVCQRSLQMSVECGNHHTAAYFRSHLSCADLDCDDPTRGLIS